MEMRPWTPFVHIFDRIKNHHQTIKPKTNTTLSARGRMITVKRSTTVSTADVSAIGGER
jgi:hypothetical protein